MGEANTGGNEKATFTFQKSGDTLEVTYQGDQALNAGSIELRSSDETVAAWNELGSTSVSAEETLRQGDTATLGPEIINWEDSIDARESIRVVFIAEDGSPTTLATFPRSTQRTSGTNATERTETDEKTATETGDELLARYRFEGDLTDETGQYDLTGTGVSYPTDAPEGNRAADWDNAYAEGPFHDIPADQPVTFCFWLRDSNTSSTWDDDMLWKLESTGNGVGSFCTPDGEVILFTSGENTIGNSNTDVLDGKWHHAAFVLEPEKSRMKLYIDGDREYDITYQDRIERTANTTLMVGRNSKDGRKQYDGGLDDLRFYTRALSQTEIRAVIEGS